MVTSKRFQASIHIGQRFMVVLGLMQMVKIATAVLTSRQTQQFSQSLATNKQDCRIVKKRNDYEKEYFELFCS